MRGVPVALIMTGGTISRIGAEKYRNLNNDYIHGFIADARFDYPIEVVDLCAKFSLALTEEDKQQMIKHTRDVNTSKVVITCGTDIMVQLARMLADHIHDKVVIVTGSMVPYKHAKSDAKMNLSCSLTYAQTLSQSGVWICMQGALFDPQMTMKDFKQKRFVYDVK